MAGLLAARVLSDHFREVVLLEADDFPESDAQRRGVPQGPHAHGLMAGGRQILDELFPGFSVELAHAGAARGDVGGQVRWFMEGARLRSFTSGIEAFGMTRPVIDRIVRARLRAIGNIHVIEKRRVDGLVLTADGRCVSGVTIKGDTLPADLVVDASGRGSRTPRWLEERGYTRPREDTIEIQLRYTTRLFRRRATDMSDDNAVAVIVAPTPLGKRGGLMIAQEGQRWIVTLINYFGEHVPPELPAFVEFARRLHAPWIYDVIRDAEPVGEAHVTSFPASVRHRYDKLKRFPSGVILVGDALSSFNPMYGQGMSVAAKEVKELGAILGDGQPDLSRRFFSRAATIIDAAWTLAACNDLRIPEVTGRRNAPARVMSSYIPLLLRAGHSDAAVVEAFIKVQNMLIPPTDLIQPAIVLRVLRAALGNVRASGPSRSDIRVRSSSVVK